MATSSGFADLAAAVLSERASRPVSHDHRGHQPLHATIPRATYRLQLNRDFTFAQATTIVSYLAELGISHCYTSPCFAAISGSTHGYDVVDPNDFNQEIGGMDEYKKFNQTLRENRDGEDHRYCPQPHGSHGQRQPLVAQHPGKRSVFPHTPIFLTSTGDR